ncbi:hypothetical protein WJX72_009608 [[Myrmecia] bisecta]|uniref:Pinin/SDK/MemA protein domain-containing protein n=1 Tax=[Myrmecia] bisecta TaxID=41462 RepID=A0AAW1QRY9_9CHLO
MNLDVVSLQQEMQDILQKRQMVDEKLRKFAPRGRGIGMGRGMQPPGGRGRGDLGGRLGPDSHFGPAVGNGAPARLHEERSRSLPQGREPVQEPPKPLERPVSRKRVLSAVVVDGEQRVPRSQADAFEEAPGTAKRPRQMDGDDNPAVKRRNMRMFGALMGTLQKFKEEDQKARQSDVAQRRKDILLRAEQRKAEEAARLRAEARAAAAAERQADINRKRELNVLADVQRLKILIAKRILRHDKLAAFIKTKTGPPLLWAPARHNEATEALLAERQQEIADWKVQEGERLEAETQRMMQRAAPLQPQARVAGAAPAAENGTAERHGLSHVQAGADMEEGEAGAEEGQLPEEGGAGDDGDEEVVDVGSEGATAADGGKELPNGGHRDDWEGADEAVEEVARVRRPPRQAGDAETLADLLDDEDSGMDE